MKREIRLLGIDDAPFDKFKDKKTLLIGVFCRGGSSVDGVLSTSVAVDGTDANRAIVRMVQTSKFYPQIRAILLKGIAVAGFNMINIQRVSSQLKIPVILVMRKMPQQDRMRRIMSRVGYRRRIAAIDAAGEIHAAGGIYIQFAGTTLAKAREIIKISISRSDVPEPVRIAHLIASGITFGQSRGKV